MHSPVFPISSVFSWDGEETLLMSYLREASGSLDLSLDLSLSIVDLLPRIQEQSPVMMNSGLVSNFAVVCVPRMEESMRILARDGFMEEASDINHVGVSTELKLYENPWKITKKLISSDIGNMSRLIVKGGEIKKYVLRFLDRDFVEKVEKSKGVKVDVFDMNTWTKHSLVFKQWTSSKSYVFIGGLA